MCLWLGFLVFFAGNGQAQDTAFCENYARLAVEQQAANQARGCGFTGPRWSSDHQHHLAWCLRVDKRLAGQERQARETTLRDACMPPATATEAAKGREPVIVPSEQVWKPIDVNGSGLGDKDPTPARVPSEQIWEPVRVTAGNQSATIEGNAVRDAATFVRWTEIQTNACRNALKIWVDPSYQHTGTSVYPILNDTDGGHFLAFENRTEVELRPLSPEDSRPTGPEQVKLTFEVNIRNDGKGPLPASNPPYYVNLIRYRAPVIDAIIPDAVYPGTTTLITVKGRNLATAGQTSTATFHQVGWSEQLVSVTPTRIQLRLTVPPDAVPGSYTLAVEKPCVTSLRRSNFTVRNPAPPPPPVPPASTEKEVLVWLKQQPAPPSGGNVPYAGTVYPVSGGVLQSLTNGNTYPGKQWGVRIVKAGYTTSDCNNRKAVVDLPPGKTTTDFQGATLASGFPIAACIYPVSAVTPPPLSIALKVRYKQ